MTDQTIPQSPEEYPTNVRRELSQHDVTHEGEERQADEGEGRSSHMGAVDTEVTPVTPPMEGPSEVTEGEIDDAGIDPAEEIPGG
jgi:hypothetical protein